MLNDLIEKFTNASASLQSAIGADDLYSVGEIDKIVSNLWNNIISYKTLDPQEIIMLKDFLIENIIKQMPESEINHIAVHKLGELISLLCDRQYKVT